MDEIVSLMKYLVLRSLKTPRNPSNEALRRKIRAAKFPCGEKSVRRKFLTAKNPYGEKSYSENSYGKNSYDGNSSHDSGAVKCVRR